MRKIIVIDIDGAIANSTKRMYNSLKDAYEQPLSFDAIQGLYGIAPVLNDKQKTKFQKIFFSEKYLENLFLMYQY